jgi:hypothetical protein
VAGRIRSIEKSNDLVRNRTHDLLASSIVPQPTTLPCAPLIWVPIPYSFSILFIYLPCGHSSFFLPLLNVKIDTIETTSFTPPSVIKLYLYVCIRLYMFRFLADHLQKANQHCKGNHHYMIYKYIKLLSTDFCTGQNMTFEATIKFLAFKMVSLIHSVLLTG